MTRYLPILLFTAATSLMGSAVGDTYDRVIADNGKPKNEMDAGAVKVLDYGDVTIRLRDDVVTSVKGVAASERPPEAPNPEQLRMMPVSQQITMINAALKRAVDKVTRIVNQPVQGYPLSVGMKAGLWQDGWYPPGADRPNFNSADIRQSQLTAPYEKYAFVTSNLNPGVAFPGKAVEFNPQTKFFYQNPNFPKKRLSAEEMLEVNRLYRVIGRCAAQMAAEPKS
ncbi:MAG TPA: hypothetical protein VFE25_05240 [Opitutaceae bacterium]|jgi:hypothetical protein|nr:hypothetical protein [Opitutaceae bacterium]